MEDEAKSSSPVNTDSASATMESVNRSECVPESNDSHPSGTCGDSEEGVPAVEVVPSDPSSVVGEGGGRGGYEAVNSAAEVDDSIVSGVSIEGVHSELFSAVVEGGGVGGEGVTVNSVVEVSKSVYGCSAVEVLSPEPPSAIDEGGGEDTVLIAEERGSVVVVGDPVDGGSALEVMPFELSSAVGEGGKGGGAATIAQEGNLLAEVSDTRLVGAEMNTEAAHLPNFDGENDYVCEDLPEDNKETSERDYPLSPLVVFPVGENEGGENREEIHGRIAADEEGNGVVEDKTEPRVESEEMNAVTAMLEGDTGQVASLADIVEEKIPDDKELASVAGFTEILPQDKGIGDNAHELGSQFEEKEPSQELHVGEEAKDVTASEDVDVIENVVDGKCIQGGETEIGESEEEENKATAIEREDVSMFEIPSLPQEVDIVAAEATEVETGERVEEKLQCEPAEMEGADNVETEPRSQEMDAVHGEVAGKNEILMGEFSIDVAQFSEEGENNQDTVMVDVEKMVEEAPEAGKSGTQVSNSAEELEKNSKTEVDIEKEGNEIGVIEEVAQIVDSEEVVETSGKATEVDETKNTEVEEEAEIRAEDEGQKEAEIRTEDEGLKEADDEVDEREDMEIHGDSSVADILEGRENHEDMEMTETQEETAMVETGEEEPEEVEDVEDENKSTEGKRKRGRNSKSLKGLAKKKEEDVCFICFDGGDLVLCDRRGCPKAYHPSCVGRDEAFFSSKGKWNCGWHLCSKCEKTATYLCYTCTFSLCKGCVKDAVFFCVRGNKGLCETCMDTVRLIESKEQEKKEPAQLDFDDKSSWEYLFKDYWIDLKAQLSITLEELNQAKSPWKGHGTHVTKPETTNKNNYATDGGSDSDSPPKRRKTRRQSKSGGQIQSVSDKRLSGENVEWASKELLDVVMHMRHGDRSFLPQSEVHGLLLEYIKRYNLRDPRRKSQVICDSRLQNLFGKSNVGHFEMLNLLDSHFLIKEESHADDIQSTAVDTEANHVDADENLDHPTKTGKDKKRKTRRKGDGRGRQSNLDDFAAIDMHNINLIYLRRSLVEDLLEDLTTFQERVVGAFVRLRISGNQKQDLYRLVQVVGTSKAAEPYKVGKKTTDSVLEILNLDKTEVISIDIISNQDFTEDECKRLRQSIKCGLINRLTVGDIQEKAIALQEVRVKNLLEGEIVRLSHLRDRASDMGRRKELRECVEKLQVLKSPEERRRRLEEIPELHTDPSMDPDCESEEEDEKEEKGKEKFLRPRSSSFNRRGREPLSPRRGGYGSSDLWGGTRNYRSGNRELNRNLSGRGFSSRGDNPSGSDDRANESLFSSGRDREMQQSVSSEKPRSLSISDTGARSSRHVATTELSPRTPSEISPAPPPTAVLEPVPKINESEKMWHYKDPSGKVQGPFSMVQLRKWNNTGYFPTDLKIWKTKAAPDDSILLTDALAGRFQKPTQTSVYGNGSGSSNQSVGGGWKSEPEFGSTVQTAPSSIEIPVKSQDTWSSGTNLPSPTPNQSTTPTATRRRNYESRWSPTPAQPSVQSTVQIPNSSAPQSGPSPVPRPDVPMVISSSGVRQPGLQPLSTTDSANTVMSHLGSVVALPSPTPAGGKQGWGNTQTEKLDSGISTQIMSHGHQGDAPSSSQSSSSFNTGTSGVFPAQVQSTFPPSDSWRVPVPSQQNNQPPAPVNIPWGMNMMNSNQNATQTQAPSNQSSSWGQVPANPNMEWGGHVQVGTNMNWRPTVPASAHGIPSSVWGGPSHGQPQAYPNPGWGMTGLTQAQAQPPRSAGSGWMQPGQGPQPGNGNPNWGSQNQGMVASGSAAFWGNQQNQNGDRFGNQREGGDPGYGWNRQSSGGQNMKGQRVCKFFLENGYCRKGASCDYIHN